ncbi:APC family permease [Clostridium hydrogenum]|uniref:APC family permease n=1 Tax=Clostridium hydrogenum TaxID=2855764 RepID=UPI001F3E6586|nr:APC family permease [Clostridium hydrogenum]
MFGKIRNLLIGQALKTEELKSEKFNVFWGLPILASDAISSVAYAGEEILYVLIPLLGILSYKYMLFAVGLIVLLLCILVFSYRQTIQNYPDGGGSYIVAKDNLGVAPGLIAAASLSIDYVLTVAVSTSAGTAAIASAVPELLNYKVIITIGLIIFMTIGNLRGLRESSHMFGIPAYIFMAVMFITIITGIVRYYVFGYRPTPVLSIPNVTGDITLFIFIKAFTSGCTALTGIEAVSNGIPNFKEPSQKNAEKVLLLLGVVILIIFGGVSFLTTLYKGVPNSNITVLSQVAAMVYGKGIMYYIVQAMTAIILVMAANTSFAGCPLLLALIAKDGYMPRQFTKRGKRLSFSNGIVLLSIAAIILILLFKGDTHLLVPLYAVGVFISFTLSQTGMFMKWIRSKKGAWRHKAFINGLGAVLAGITAIMQGVTKFKEGAWIVIILVPVLVFMMLSIKKHYNKVAGQLKLPLDEKPKQIDMAVQKNYMILPIDTLNKSFLKALNYARCISDNIIVFHVSVDDGATEKLKKRWDEYNLNIPLVIKKSPYRSLVGPLVKFIESEEFVTTPRDTITVVIPQFVVKKWWLNFLHNQTALFVKSVLLKRRNIAVTTIPYIIEE